MPKGQPNKRYTGEFKQMVVETMHDEKLGYNETMRKFGISAHDAILKWERISLEEGAEDLYVERRGRGSKGRYLGSFIKIKSNKTPCQLSTHNLI